MRMGTLNVVALALVVTAGCRLLSSGDRLASPAMSQAPAAEATDPSTSGFVPRGKLEEPAPRARVALPAIANDEHIQPTSVTAPADAAPADDGPMDPGLGTVRGILERAMRFQDKYPDYILRLTRLEVGRSPSPEVILLKLRTQPRSAYLRWLDDANEGRECLWVEGKNNGKMISRGGRGDMLLAGRILRLDPNGTLARSKSSMPITDSGLDVILDKIEARLTRLESGDDSLGTLRAERGSDESTGEVYDWIVHDAPRGIDADLKHGGVHRYGFRRDNGRIEVVHATDLGGGLVYSFRFERFLPISDLSDADFDPDVLWPKQQAGARPTSSRERMVLSDDVPVQ